MSAKINWPTAMVSIGMAVLTSLTTMFATWSQYNTQITKLETEKAFMSQQILQLRKDIEDCRSWNADVMPARDTNTNTQQ